MPYIGNSPANIGNYQVVDDISPTFNGVLTSFALTALTLPINPAKSGQLLVNVNGVLQEPDDTGTDGFLVSGSNIVFSSAPAAGATFWAVWQGQAVDIGTPSDATVGTDQLSATGTKSGTTYLSGDNTWKAVDADLLDGIQGSSFLRGDANDTASGIVTFNHGSNATSTSNGSVRIVGGLGVAYNVYANAFLRQGNTVWDAGNDGAGSGLDADLLGGQQASAFAPTSNSPYYLGVSGTGVLNGTSSNSTVNTLVVKRIGDGKLIEFSTGGFSPVGGIETSFGSTSYLTSSDYRLKENDVPMVDALARVKALRPINFAWKSNDRRVDGFLAHELQEVVPEAVSGTKDAMREEEYEMSPSVVNAEGIETTAAVRGTRDVPQYQGIDQSKLVPLLTAAIQELIARIEVLEGA